MESVQFGIIIRVNNLDESRNFYRNLFFPLEPEIDSSFVVEFRFPGGMALVLEKTEAKYLRHAVDAAALAIEKISDDELDVLKERLNEAGFPLSDESFVRGRSRYFRGTDPEGNIFYVADPAYEPDSGKN